MKNNRAAVWIFVIVLAVIAVASTTGFSERINLWLGKQDEPAMAQGEGAGDAGQAAAPETAAETPAGETEEAAAPSGEDMAETPAGEAAEAAAEPEAEAGDEQAAVPETDAEQQAMASPDAATAEEAGAADEAAAPSGVVVPSFGLLRVEPDGSTLIAGSAGPNADIEILTRSTTIASTKAEANGDFVAVLDDPLEPGDYEIVLRATEEDGDVAMSEETAIVSVPEPGREGDLLALVERPGAPSRLINTPEPEQGATGEAADEEMAEAETAAAGTETMPSAEEPAEEASVGSEAAEKTAMAEEPASGGEVETAAADTAEAAGEEEMAEVAEATEAAGGEAAPKPEPAKTAIRIEAVEIDSDTIFVAGAADAGAQVRVYANEFLLGDTVTSPGGRFLVQVRKDLAVGDYIIRADVIDPATAEVIARAAVPFTRSEGERVAAVADDAAVEPATETTEEAAPAAEAEATPEPAAAEQTAQPEAEPKAVATEEQIEEPSEEPAKPDETEMAATEEPAVTATEEAASGEETAEPAMAETPMAETPEAGESATAEAEAPSAEPAQEMAKAPEPATEETAMPSEEAAGSGEGGEQVAAAPETAAPPEVSDDITVTGRLRQTNSSVIIRRGDTLWHISRRVYGKGTRYTTIYLANQDQIEDPDMIWPGQIFELPEEAAPEN